MNADDKSSLLKNDNFAQPIEMQLSNKQKGFSKSLLHFWNLAQILNILQKKMTLIACVVPKLRTGNDVVRWVSPNTRLRRPFEKQDVKWCKTLSKSAQQQF